MGSFLAATSGLDKKILATFPSSRQHTAALFAFIKRKPQKPSLTLRGLEFGPHLPTSEFVCVDELWSHSAGMFFCGDYKDPYGDWEASTKLSHSDFV